MPTTSPSPYCLPSLCDPFAAYKHTHRHRHSVLLHMQLDSHYVRSHKGNETHFSRHLPASHPLFTHVLLTCVVKHKKGTMKPFFSGISGSPLTPYLALSHLQFSHTIIKIHLSIRHDPALSIPSATLGSSDSFPFPTCSALPTQRHMCVCVSFLFHIKVSTGKGQSKEAREEQRERERKRE